MGTIIKKKVKGINYYHNLESKRTGEIPSNLRSGNATV